MTNHVSYRLRIPEAERLASLGGIEQDLRGVISYCDRLIKNSEISRLNFIELEAVGSAALIRYARCFSSGVRDPISHALLNNASADLREFHQYCIDLRSKHVAHSINPFEENEVLVQIPDDCESSSEIKSLGAFHSRVICLSAGGVEKLKELAEWVASRVAEEMEVEKEKLLEIAKSVPLEQLRSSGMVVGVGASTERGEYVC